MSTNRILGLITVLAMGGILALGWFLGVSPQLAAAAKADADAAAAREQNAGYELVLDALEEQFAQIETHRAQLAALGAEIPPSASVEDFADSVLATAGGNGLTLKELTIGEGVLFGASGESDAPADAPAKGGLASLPVTITVQGDHGKAMDFAHALQTASRLFLVTDVNLGTAESGNTLTGHIFVLQQDAPAPPATIGEPEATASD